MSIELEELQQLSKKEIYDNIILPKLSDFTYLYDCKNTMFTLEQVRHLSVNFAIDIMHGSCETFDEYYCNTNVLTFFSIEEKCHSLLYEKENFLIKLSTMDIWVLISDIDDYIKKKKRINFKHIDSIITYDYLSYVAETYKIESIKDPNCIFDDWYKIFDRYNKINKIILNVKRKEK